jgi:hypothetical protein
MKKSGIIAKITKANIATAVYGGFGPEITVATNINATAA